MRTLAILILSIMLVSCVSKERERELLERIDTLQIQLDDCKNGAEPLHAKMLLEYEQKKYETCKVIYRQMAELHPQSDLFPGVKKLYAKVIAEQEALAERERLAAEELVREAAEKLKIAEEQRLKSLKKLKKNHDDVSGVTWYKNPYFSHYYSEHKTSIYFGDDGNSKWLRLRMSYGGDDWIFFERAFLSYDGNTMEIKFDKYRDKETDNGSGSVWEWIDVSVSKDLETFLRDYSKSKNAKMRLSGKYTQTRTLSWEERQGLRDVLAGYDALKNS